MTWADIAILAILALGVIHGWRAGFVVAFGNVLSLVAGMVITGLLFSFVDDIAFLAAFKSAHPILMLLAFVAVFLLVIRLLRLVVSLLNGLFRIISIIPGVGLINRILGAVVGVIEGGVFAAILLYVAVNYLVPSGFVSSAFMSESAIISQAVHILRLD
ncbi:CvpA family protein [Candidatus Uhrbacteria bacterium]|nr:CvpA family protein [Candidatus Uhrbacteria bacterium]